MTPLQKALHNIVLAHMAAKRRELSSDIALLQEHLKDTTDLISSQAGAHWATRQVSVERSDGTDPGWISTYKVAAEFFGLDIKTFTSRLNSGKGRCFITIRDGYPKRNKDAGEYLVEKI